MSAVLEYLSKLSHVVKNEVAEKADYNTGIKDIGDTTAADLNAKIEEVKGEIPSIALLQLLLLLLLRIKYLTIVNISLVTNLLS